MGKHRNSTIYAWWSDWHYNNQQLKREAYMTDVDVTSTTHGDRPRSFYELRKGKKIVAGIDLKWQDSIREKLEKITVTESIVSKEIEEKLQVPYYVVGIELNGHPAEWQPNQNPKFHIYRPYLTLEKLIVLSEEQMVDWINVDYDPDFLKQKGED